MQSLFAGNGLLVELYDCVLFLPSVANKQTSGSNIGQLGTSQANKVIATSMRSGGGGSGSRGTGSSGGW